MKRICVFAGSNTGVRPDYVTAADTASLPTTIAQPMRAIGEGTVRLLLEILGGRATPPESVTLPHTLIIRSSTAPPQSA